PPGSRNGPASTPPPWPSIRPCALRRIGAADPVRFGAMPPTELETTGPGRPGGVEPVGDEGRADWRRVLVVFWITSMVEGLGVSQVFAFLPAYLRVVGVSD